MAGLGESRAEAGGLDELEMHPAPVLGKEWNVIADQHRVDAGPVLDDQVRPGRLCGEAKDLLVGRRPLESAPGPTVWPSSETPVDRITLRIGNLPPTDRRRAPAPPSPHAASQKADLVGKVSG